MSVPRARLTMAACVLLLVGLAVAVACWPDDGGRADLRTVPPVVTGSTAPVTAPATVGSPTATTVPPSTTTLPPPVGIEPSRLSIPSLGIDSVIVPVGLAPDQQMEVPPATEVGWYELGPRPGAPGSAVLAAHVDYDGRRGAFFDLAGIAVGDEVLVDGGGGTRRFVVTSREQVAKAEVRLDRYFTAEGPERLTLITCGGAFSRSAGHYEDNIIITATPA